MSVFVRFAIDSDIEAITAIHNEGIVDRIATLDLEPKTVEEKVQWFKGHGPREPIIVAEDGGRVVGFAALSLFSPRQCYAHISTLSIYVARSHRGLGVGSKLLQAIIEQGKAMGYGKIILNAFAFNEAAMSLYRKFGFRHVGTYEKQGQLDDRWVDTVIMERHLVERE